MNPSYTYFKTTQRGAHSALHHIIHHHRQTVYHKPIADHQVQAFKSVNNFINQDERPIILDSGCGTGLSSVLLAQKYPDHLVIGFDKSKGRLARLITTKPSNCFILRADAIDFWRLLSEHQWPIAKHFLFFPNPWPKASQLKRRFHAHPVFSVMANLSPYLELRTNWLIYAEECVLALRILGHDAYMHEKDDGNFMSLFEKKYLESKCPIYIIKSYK
jgi:tRNA G46 methylase TrmB